MHKYIKQLEHADKLSMLCHSFKHMQQKTAQYLDAAAATACHSQSVIDRSI